jgi:hypothetical protein
VNALGWEGGTTKHPPDAPHWKPPPTEVYSADCVEEEFSEVHGSKQPLRRSGKHSTTACWHPFSVETLQLGSSSCTVVYQGVATRNIPTTREICLKDETFRSPRRLCEAVHQGRKNVTVL